MAAFYRYSCSWHGCGKHCGSLLDLIDHIEGVHIEKDPRILEKQEAAQPSAIPLSYINCFFTEAARSAQRNRKEQLSSESTIPSPDSNIKKKRISPPKLSISSSVSNESVDGIDEEGNLSDVSDDSWSSDTFASDWIMNAVTTDDGEGKRYICPVPGCGKRYKNVNGIKYHAKNGHRKEKGVRKAHKCHCGKSYKSPSGLRHHIMTQHPTHPQLTSNHTIHSPHEVENVA